MQLGRQLPDSLLQGRTGSSFVCRRRFRDLASGLFCGEFLLRGAELLLHGLQPGAQGTERFFALLDGQAQRSQPLLQPFAGLGSEEPLQLLEAIGQRHAGVLRSRTIPQILMLV